MTVEMYATRKWLNRLVKFSYLFLVLMARIMLQYKIQNIGTIIHMDLEIIAEKLSPQDVDIALAKEKPNF